MNAPQIISLGCRMNIAESERLRAMLARETDLVVVNSCAVTGEALSQTRKAIRRARRDHPTARLVVTGDPGADVMTLRCKATREDTELQRAVAESLREVMRLRGEVAFVASGSLPQDGKVIEDARRYE